MKLVVAVFVLALVLAPVASLQPQSQYQCRWPGTYAHWHPSDNQWEGLYIAWNDAPPPRPADQNNCIPWNPWLCKGDRPPLRGL